MDLDFWFRKNIIFASLNRHGTQPTASITVTYNRYAPIPLEIREFLGWLYAISYSDVEAASLECFY